MGFKLHRPDPSYISSRRSQNNFKLALKIALTFLALLWLIHLANWFSDYQLSGFGIHPRRINGLLGIIFAPLLHANWSHLISNSLPLFVLMSGMLFVYPNSSSKALPAIYFASGLLVWAFGRSFIHIGASSLVYGMLAYVFFAGIMKRDVRGISLSMLVYFLYSSLIYGIFPQAGSVSWESHFAAAAVGTVLAIWYRHWDIPPRQVYSWETEEED